MTSITHHVDDEPYGGSSEGAWRAIDWTAHERRISIAGHMLNYVDIGEGEVPIVLLHGHGATWRYWLEVIALLAPKHRVVALDIPGFGASEPHSPATISIARLVEVISAFLDRLGITRCDLVGHSMGSVFAIEIAAAAPARVRSLTLAGGPPSSIVSLLQKPLASAWRNPGLAFTVFKVVLGGSFPIPPRLRRFVAGSRRLRKLAFGVHIARPAEIAADLATHLMGGVGAPAHFHVLRKARQYRPAAIEDVTSPVLLFNGDADSCVSSSDIDAFVARSPNARRNTIAGAGHLVTVEYPRRFVQLLEDFIASSAHSP